MNYVALHLAISLQSPASLQTILRMDGRRAHDDLGFVFNALHGSCLISKKCDHVMFSALLKSRVMLIYVALCIAHYLFTMTWANNHFLPQLHDRTKSKWAILLYSITTLFYASTHFKILICSPVQHLKVFGKCHCRWQLYDRWSMRLLLFFKKKRE